MDNVQAALLLPQLERVDQKLGRRQALAAQYRAALSGIHEVAVPRTLPGVRHAEHLFTIWVDPARRDQLLSHLKDRRIAAMVNYRAIHLLDYYTRKFQLPRGSFPVAERIGDSTISLPLYPSMPRDHVDIVTRAIRDFFAKPAT
jgi:UDP-4-amino-4-deoxy-L-arabinose-oxoglutarate aminotransferase